MVSASSVLVESRTSNISDDDKIKPPARSKPKKKSTLEITDLNHKGNAKQGFESEEEQLENRIQNLEETMMAKREDSLELKKFELEQQLKERQQLLEIELLKKKLEETERAMAVIIAKMDSIPSKQQVRYFHPTR